MQKKIFFYIITGVVAIILFIVIANRMGWIGGAAAIEVTLQASEKRDITETVAASGKIYPETEVKISSEVSGEIIQITIQEGDSVKKGDLLIAINPDIYQSMVDRAEAALNQARANLATSRAREAQAKAQAENAEISFNRNKRLFEQKVISDSEFESAQVAFSTARAEQEAAAQSVEAARFNIKSAEAALREARDNLNRTTIRAPMNGIVSMLGVEVGERVVGTAQMLGTEILRIADFDVMEVRVEVSEADILRVGIGDSAKIEVDAYLGETFKGVVTRVAHSANVQAGQLVADQATNFKVYIRLDPQSYAHVIQNLKSLYPFRPGMSATVDVLTAFRSDVIAVPIQSVTLRGENENDADTEVVFIYQDGVVVQRAVKTGIQDDRFIEIKSGVEDGEKVVSGPFRAVSRELSDGVEVSTRSR